MGLRRIAIYYRVSTDKQDFDSQKHAIEHWIAAHKPDKVEVFSDHAVSGTKFRRPGLQKMLIAARKNKFDAIVTYRLDRLSRTAMDALEICLKLDRLGIELICVKQNLFTTLDNPFRRTMLTLFAELAEIERSIMIDRIKSGLAAAKARGVKLGPPSKITGEIRERIFLLRANGNPMRRIAELTGLSIGAVHRVLKKREISEVVC